MPAATTRLTQTERREMAEQRITEAATKIIAEKGLHGLTLAEAGERAGYSRGIASHHFGKKNVLLISVVNYIAAQFNNRLKKQTAINDGIDMVYAVIDQYFYNVSRNTHITLAFQVIIAEGLTNPALQPAIAEMNEHAIKNLTHHLKQAVIQKEIRSSIDPKKQATILIANLRGIMTLWMIDKKRTSLNAIKKELLENLQTSWKTGV